MTAYANRSLCQNGYGYAYTHTDTHMESCGPPESARPPRCVLNARSPYGCARRASQGAAKWAGTPAATATMLPPPRGTTSRPGSERRDSLSVVICRFPPLSLAGPLPTSLHFSRRIPLSRPFCWECFWGRSTSSSLERPAVCASHFDIRSCSCREGGGPNVFPIMNPQRVSNEPHCHPYTVHVR